MNGYYLKPERPLRRLSWALSLVLGLSGTLLLPQPAHADESQTLTWARIDFIRNRVQLVPQDQRGRRANLSDVLSVGDSLRTARASRAELRFNDGSLARIGERATFRFTPDTRNFQLSNGTILLLIPPGRGRSTIQTPNAVTGIQGSALFVRYIPETDTTIVGALTNNPNGPMVLFNRDGTEQQALRANEIGVIQGDQITEIYQFDGTLFWQSSGLADGFNYLSESPSSTDELNGVRREIREAVAAQEPVSGDNTVTNPRTFAPPADAEDLDLEVPETNELTFENSPAEDYLEGSSSAIEDLDTDSPGADDPFLDREDDSDDDNSADPTNPAPIDDGGATDGGDDDRADPTNPAPIDGDGDATDSGTDTGTSGEDTTGNDADATSDTIDSEDSADPTIETLSEDDDGSSSPPAQPLPGEDPQGSSQDSGMDGGTSAPASPNLDTGDDSNPGGAINPEAGTAPDAGADSPPASGQTPGNAGQAGNGTGAGATTTITPDTGPPTTGSEISGDETPGGNVLGNQVPDGEMGAPAGTAPGQGSVPAGGVIDSTGAAAGTDALDAAGAEPMTAPTLDTPPAQPIPEEVNKLDELQGVPEMETMNNSGNSTGNPVP